MKEIFFAAALALTGCSSPQTIKQGELISSPERPVVPTPTLAGPERFTADYLIKNTDCQIESLENSRPDLPLSNPVVRATFWEPCGPPNRARLKGVEFVLMQDVPPNEDNYIILATTAYQPNPTPAP